MGGAKVLRPGKDWLPKSCEKLSGAGTEEVNGRRVHRQLRLQPRTFSQGSGKSLSLSRRVA